MTEKANQEHEELPKPPWIRARVGHGERYIRLRNLLENKGLHTVCSEALCPNRGRCWENGRATLLILGETCSRQCTFCGVRHAWTCEADPDEPRRAAEAVQQMGLKEVVITSVTRDDLADGGAAIWSETIRRIRALPESILVEVLVPDFAGQTQAIDRVVDAHPDVWGHNLETVPSLYGRVRPGADYQRSLDVLKRGSDAGLIAKTSLMLGLGETLDEVRSVMQDARRAGCRILAIGQYLRPSRSHCPVRRYVEPAEFDALREEGQTLGFDVVISAPLVRSSFHTDEQSAFLTRELAS
jgi:lipoic acid synthetase